MNAELLKSYWPLIVTFGLGLIGYGTLQTDVAHIKQQQDVITSDHDRIVRIEEQQKRTADDVSEMKQDLKEIAKAVKD